MQFVFITVDIIRYASLILEWRVSSEVVHSGIIIYYYVLFWFSLNVKWMAYH
ncbi:hypothetical protein BD408DRAFT_425654 [Parasitella parasitica]|nr:hypothetical protein BD408DRAFT_425654 [Parasitella parasitica]